MPGMATGPAAPVDIADIRSRLGRRISFESSAADLTSVLLRQARCRQLNDAHHAPDACNMAVWEAVNRCFTLLRSRYTSPAFWRAGRMLFQAALAVAATAEQVDAAKAYLAACDAHLAEQEADVQPAPANSGQRQANAFLFEGQMSAEHEPQAQAPGIQDLLGLLVGGGRLNSQPEQPDTAAPASEQAEQGTADEPAAADRLRALDDLFQQFRDAFGADNAHDMEAALRASLEEEGNRHGPPPASKRAVKALVRDKLTAARLQQLGPDVECSVCREELKEGDEVQLMPCSAHHVFHMPCLAPWLKEHNSCPVCRFELETDDVAYETQKERAAIEEEERKGAEAAQSHNDFMYL